MSGVAADRRSPHPGGGQHRAPVSTRARCARYSGEAARSWDGRRPSAADRAARATPSASPAPDSACSVAVARSGVGPMLVRPTRASAMRRSSRRTSRGHADDGPGLRGPVELLVVEAPARPAWAPAPPPGARRVRAPSEVVDEELARRGSRAARPDLATKIARPAPAPRRAGRPPGRRARASRRTCPGGVRRDRRPSRWPAPASGVVGVTSGSRSTSCVRGHRADDERVALARARPRSSGDAAHVHQQLG